MPRFKRVGSLVAGAIGVAALMLVVACGGGGGTAGSGQRITDPAKVPTSTPISGGQVYKIQGDGLILIGGATGSTTPTTARTYTVVSGDSCAGIAAKNNVSLDDLLRANRAIDNGCTNLRVGDVLRLPAAPTPAGGSSGQVIGGPGTPKPGAAKSYKVASGDTCDAIARNQGTDVTKLQAANPGMDCTNLQIGQTINIPG